MVPWFDVQSNCDCSAVQSVVCLSNSLAAAPIFLLGATRHFVWLSCKIRAEIVVYRMFAVFLNGLNGKKSSRRQYCMEHFFICMCCTSTWPVNKQVLAFTLFVRNSSHPVYDDCSMKKQPISTAVVLEFRELLKWITKWYWNLSELYECKHICHRDRFIFYITLWVFHNANKSKLLTLIKKNSYVQLFYKLSSSCSHRN